MRRGSVPLGPLSSRVRAYSSEYEIDRRVGGNDDSYGSGYEYENTGTAELYLYDPELTNQVVMTGEQQQGSLQGLCLPEEDIEVHDRLSYGQGRYEVVEPINGLPTEDDPSILQLSLERVSASTMV